MSLVESNPALPSTLAEREAIIERGLSSFLDVGSALIAIKRDRQYREAGYPTFEDYCARRFQISRGRAYQLVAAAATTAALAEALPEMSTAVDIPLPTSERQVRPLASLEPEQQVEAWSQAVEAAGGSQPTAAQVEAAADGLAAVRDLTPQVVPGDASTREGEDGRGDGDLDQPVAHLPEHDSDDVHPDRMAEAIAEFPFLAEYPPADIIPTADALRAIPEGPLRDKRIEAAKTWPAAVAAQSDIAAISAEPPAVTVLRTAIEDAVAAVAHLADLAPTVDSVEPILRHVDQEEAEDWRRQLITATQRLTLIATFLAPTKKLRSVK